MNIRIAGADDAVSLVEFNQAGMSAWRPRLAADPDTISRGVTSVLRRMRPRLLRSSPSSDDDRRRSDGDLQSESKIGAPPGFGG